MLKQMSHLYFHTGLKFFFLFTLQYYTISPTLLYALATFIVSLYVYHIVIHMVVV